MADQEPVDQDTVATPRKNKFPWGLLIGIALGIAIGLVQGDWSLGTSLAVAFGISFHFLAPLVRKYVAKGKSDG